MDIATFILLAVVCLVVGFLIGRMVRQLSESDGQSFPREEKLDDDDVHIARSDSTGKLIVLHNRKIYHDVRSLPLEVHNKVLQMLVDLQLWSGHPQKPKIGDAYEKDVLLNKKPPTFPDITEIDEKEPAALISSISHPLREGAADIKASKSIVAQIDEILQRKLMVSDLCDKGISLGESPTKGLVVMVGLDQYEDIEDIPDESIIEIIRQAVSEWEASANKR